MFKKVIIGFVILIVLCMSVSAQDIGYSYINLTGAETNCGLTIGPNTGGYGRAQTINVSSANFTYLKGVSIYVGTVTAGLNLSFIITNQSSNLPDFTQMYTNFTIPYATILQNGYNEINLSTPIKLSPTSGIIAFSLSFENTTAVQEAQLCFNAGSIYPVVAKSYALRHQMGTTAGWTAEASDLTRIKILLANETNASAPPPGPMISPLPRFSIYKNNTFLVYKKSVLTIFKK